MLLATGLALASAVLHAAWNLLVKTSPDRYLAAWGQFLFGGLLFVPVLIVAGFPGAGEALPFLVASGITHIGYVSFLVNAYQHGDFSLAYPLARGTGAVAAAVGGVALLDDSLSIGAWVAIALVVGGLVTLAGPSIDRVTVSWALLTGAMIGTYTLVDAAGARRSDGFAYGPAVTLSGAVFLTLYGVARGRGRAFVGALPEHWRRWLLAGVFLTAAYTLVMVAVSLEGVPVGYVAVLRESSVVLGAYAGWVLLDERLGGRRLAASLVVTAGLALLVLLR